MSSEDPVDGLASVPDAAPASSLKGLAPEDRSERILLTIQRFAPFVVLAVTVVLGGVAFGGHFLNSDVFRVIGEGRVSLALVAIGMTFVIISGGIDLSVGSMLALGAVLTAYGSVHFGPAAAVMLPLVTCAAIGFVNGLLIAKAKMPPFLVTLTALLFARGLALFITKNATNIPLVNERSGIVRIGRGVLFGVPVPVIIAAVLFGLAGVILNRTRSGQSVFALGGSEDAAVLMGLPVDRIKIALYTGTSMLAGLAGMITATRSISGDPNLALGLELEAIAAVVIGGTLLTGGFGTISGTLAGVLLLGVIRAVINQQGHLVEYHQQLVLAGFLFVVVIAQQLLNRRRRG